MQGTAWNSYSSGVSGGCVSSSAWWGMESLISAYKVLKQKSWFSAPQWQELETAHVFLISYWYQVLPDISLALFLQFGQWNQFVACSPSETYIKIPEASYVFQYDSVTSASDLLLTVLLFLPRHCRISLVL